jgi:hypothetical protein
MAKSLRMLIAGLSLFAISASSFALEIGGDLAYCMRNEPHPHNPPGTIRLYPRCGAFGYHVGVCKSDKCETYIQKDENNSVWYPYDGVLSVVFCRGPVYVQGNKASCSPPTAPVPTPSASGSSKIGSAGASGSTTGSSSPQSPASRPTDKTTSRPAPEADDKREYVDHAKRCVHFRKGKHDPQVDMVWYEISNSCSSAIKVWYCDAILKPDCNPVTLELAEIKAGGKSSGHWTSTRNGKARLNFVACPAKHGENEVHADHEDSACFYRNGKAY